MGIGQLVMFALMGGAGYFAFTRMKGMQAGTTSSFAELGARLDGEFAATRRPGESEAAFVAVATQNKFQANHAFMIAVTNQRVLLQDPRTSDPTRSFDRAAVKIRAPRQRWTDTGNMQTTTSEGWEVSVQLPGGEVYEGLRLYGENPYYPVQSSNVQRFLSAVGSA